MRGGVGAIGLGIIVTSGVLATWAHAHGTYHELVADLDRQIAASPEDPALHARRAFLHLEHGEWKASLADADEADRMRKDDPGVNLIRARALSAGGRFDEAMAALDRFIASHPGHAACLMERARVRGRLGQAALAADDFAVGMRGVAEPEPEQVFEMTSFFCRAGKNESALEALDAALQRMHGLQSLVDRAVEIEMELGRHDAALRRMDAAIQGARIKEPLLAKRAALLGRTGRTQDSIAAWKELQTRIADMPPLERGSHAMSRLSEQARFALESLASLSAR